jgi:hypothetical protein
MRRLRGGRLGTGRAVCRDANSYSQSGCITNESVDVADIASVAVMEWRVVAENEKDVLEFYQSEAAPTIASSPDVLRFRLFKIKSAMVLKAGSCETLGKENIHTYLTLAELESDEWPWDVVVALGEKPKWREYFEGQNIAVSNLVVIGVLIADKLQKWQSSHYLAKRSYPDGEEGGGNE